MSVGIASICEKLAAMFEPTKLRSDTPEFERYIYNNKKGVLDDLIEAFGKTTVANAQLMGYLKADIKDIWRLTRRGRTTIVTFNTDLNAWDNLKNFFRRESRVDD